MNFTRGLIRLFLVLIFLISSFVLVKALLFVDSEKANAWNAIAASLAVITAIISTWGANKIIEQQEDAKKPYPYLYFDVSSRYQLVLLAIMNSGGSPSYNVSITWDKPLINFKGENIPSSEIPILLPNENISIVIDQSASIFENQDLNYSGKMTYYNSSNKLFQRDFKISLEQYRGTLLYSDESLKTHYQIQQLPDILNKIESELKKIREKIHS
jgi:hypothetical protein